MSYHDRIMNIRYDIHDDIRKLGHRDARHAAAEIANEADAEIERLRAENFTLSAGACHVPDGLVGDERGNFYCAKVAEIERLRAALQGIVVADWHEWPSAYNFVCWAKQRARYALMKEPPE